MHHAARHSNLKMICFLKAQGVAVDNVNAANLTPLQLAVSSSSLSFDVVEELVKGGADVNAGEIPPLYTLSGTVEDDITEEARKVAKFLLKNNVQLHSSQFGAAFFDNYEECYSTSNPRKNS